MNNDADEIKQADMDDFMNGITSILAAFAQAVKAIAQAIVKVMKTIIAIVRKKKNHLYKTFLKAYPEYFEKLEAETHAGS